MVNELLCLIAVAILGCALVCYAMVLIIRHVYLMFFSRGYFVKKAAKELKCSEDMVEARFNEVLSQAKQHCAYMGAEMHFTHFYPCNKLNELGMATSYKALRLIAYAPVWVYLVTTRPRLWSIAFMQSVGHEFNHRFDAKKGKRFYFRSKEERRFYYWLREVRNDFEGVSFVKCFYPQYARKTILNAVEKKGEFYDKGKKPSQRESMTHPSWHMRVALLKKYDAFSLDVVEEVARAAGCKNRDYIIELLEAYDMFPF